MLDLLFAAALGASLMAVSTIAAARWGHVIGGVLSAFPRRCPPSHRCWRCRRSSSAGEAVLDLLRGMLGGMAAFVLFCAPVGLPVEPAGVAAAFVLATAAAVLV